MWKDLCPVCEGPTTTVGEMVSPTFMLECYCPKMHYIRKRALATGTPLESYNEDAREYLEVVCGIEETTA